MNNRLVPIAIGGYAGSGKDTLCKCLTQILKEEYGINVHKVAFAEPVKMDLDKTLRRMFNISAFTENRDEKAVIRPMLEGYTQSRRISNPNYWVERNSPRVDRIMQIPGNLSISTDIRYLTELKFLKEERKSFNLYISMRGVTAVSETERKAIEESRQHYTTELVWDKNSDEEYRMEVARSVAKNYIAHISAAC